MGNVHIKKSELSGGAAGVKQKSNAQVACGFNTGLDNMVKASKAATSIKHEGIGAGLKPKAGVWGNGFQRP